MAKNINHVSHIKSKQIVNGKPKLPEASSLVEGEIAINFGKDVETLSIKNESGDVVTFSCDNYYTEEKLGSGFTGENSGKTVTEAIAEATVTVDQVLGDTTSASTNPVSSKAVYKAVTDNELVWTNAYTTLSGAVSSHTVDNSIHTTAAEKEKLSNIEAGAEVNVQSNWDETNTTSDAYIQNKPTLGTAAAKGVSNGITNTDNLIEAKHIYSGVGVTISYNSTTKYIQLESKSGSVISSFDASAFIKDGMVDNVVISGNNLVITFNTDSGKEAISIPLTDIFDPSNYLTKEQLTGTTNYTTVTKANSANTASTVALTGVTDADDLKAIEALTGTSGILKKTAANTWTLDTTSYSSATEVQAALNAKANTATTLAGYGITDAYTKSETSGKTELATAFNSIDTLVGSGFTSSSITDVVIENEKITSTALIDLNERKLDASAYTPTDLSNYYTKDETSGATQLSTAFGNKANTATTLAGYGITDAYTKSETSGATQLSTAFGNKANTATTLAGYGITDAYTKSETSGKTEIQNALDAKVNTADIVTAITPSNSGSSNPIATSVVAENELIVSNALTDLDARKLDATAYTPTDLSDYYKKSETSGKTEIQNALGAKTDTATTTALNNVVTAHTANTTVHVTASDKTTWNAKLDASAIANFFDDAKYEDSGTTKVINFYHGNTIKATIDASDFIVDGMVDDVRIENGNLVIDFNTASGKQDISIPLTSIFDPSNYYNKTAIDNLVGSGFTSSSITEVIIENEEITSAALTELDARKLDASAYTPTDLSNYYKKSETSGATQLSTAFGNKANTATTLAGYGITDAYTKSETSGKTEIQSALNAKADNSAFTAHTANTDIHVTAAERTSWNTAVSGVTDLSGQSETIAAALVELNTKLATALEKANAALAALGGVTIQKITQAEYDALTTKDPNKLYVITD